MLTERRFLGFFGHIARSAPDMKTITVQLLLQFASLHQTGNNLQQDPTSRGSAIESDLRPLNIGPSYEWKKAASREHWHSIVDTTTLKKSMP